MKQVILDCDTGEDDAIAILVALANNLPVSHIITSYGNTTVQNATRNTSRLLSLVSAQNIQVVRGFSCPIVPHPIEPDVSAGAFVGKNGLCNTKLPPSRFQNVIEVADEDIVSLFCSLIYKKSPVDYIITGPCTNFASVCRAMGSEVKKYVHRVYLMGAALDIAGNSGPVDPATGQAEAEFNWYCDPHAVQTILASGLSVWVVPWDVTSTLKISEARIQGFAASSQAGGFAVKLMKNFFTYYGHEHIRSFELNDPVTILAYLGYGSWQKKHIGVITETAGYGRVFAHSSGVPVFWFAPANQQKQEIEKKILQDLDISEAESRQV